VSWLLIFSTSGELSLLQYGKMYMEAFLKSGMPVLDLLLRPRKVTNFLERLELL
jgi:hypothetical protein